MISVVFPTRNRAALLSAALDSLTRQTLPVDRFEVLVVDNGSTDATPEVAQAFQERLGNLRYFLAPRPGLHVGRHRGMQEARGDVLVFADDDIEALPTWLAAIETVFSDSQVAMAGGNNLPLFLQPPPAWLQAMWDQATVPGGRALPPLSLLELRDGQLQFSPYHVFGCNFAIRKSVLQAAGGFHPDGVPRDLIRFRGDGETHVSQFVLDSGLKCVFDPAASVHHKVTPERMTHAYFRQRGFDHGVSDSYSALRRPGSGEQASPASAPRRLAGWGLRQLRHWTMDGQHRAAVRALAAGYQEGYAYHQRVYREDPEVRAWVHKPNYYEE